MFAFARSFEAGLPYDEFLQRFGTPEQRSRWDSVHRAVRLTDEQTALLAGFVRDMRVIVMAGTWCGDCVNQCPIFDRFASVSPRLQIRYVDRDADAELAAEMQTCGAARVPAVVFLSEDGQFCGRYGDRTLAKYRRMMSRLSGATCPSGLFTEQDELDAVVGDWLGEFERIQAMLRTSARLRQLHND